MNVTPQCRQPFFMGALFHSRLVSGGVIVGVLCSLDCSTDTQAPVGGDTSSQIDEIVQVPPMQSGYMPVELTYDCGPERIEAYWAVAHATLPVRSIPVALRNEFEFEGKPLQMDKQVCYRIHTQDGALHRVTGTRCEAVTFKYEDHRYLFPDSNVLYGTLQDLTDWVAPIGEDILGVEFDPTEGVTFHQGHPVTVRGIFCSGPNPATLAVDNEAQQITATFPQLECEDHENRIALVQVRNINHILGGTTEIAWEEVGLVAGAEVTRAGTEIIGYHDLEHVWGDSGFVDDHFFTPLNVKLTFSDVTNTEFSHLTTYTSIASTCFYQDGLRRSNN